VPHEYNKQMDVLSIKWSMRKLRLAIQKRHRVHGFSNREVDSRVGLVSENIKNVYVPIVLPSMAALRPLND